MVKRDYFKIIKESKHIGTIGSPNRVIDFTMDLKSEAMDEAIHSRLVAFIHRENEDKASEEKIVLAIVTEMININPWHQNINLKSIIRERGTIPFLSNSSNTITTRLQILTALTQNDGELMATTIGTPPKSGTTVHEIPRMIFTDYKMKQKWYLGYLRNQDIPVPISLRHFGNSRSNDGLGEAQFTGIFGKTGSGKSVFATQIMVGYARFTEMGMLIIDPQGQYYRNNFGDSANFNWDFHGLLRSVRPANKLMKITLKDLTFDSTELYSRILLETGFADTIASSSRGTYEEAFAENLKESLKHYYDSRFDEDINFSIYDITLKDLIQYDENNLSIENSGPIINALFMTYQEKTAKEKSNKAQERSTWNKLNEKFNQIRNLFNTKGVDRISIKNLVNLILVEKMCVILNISNFKELGNLGRIDEIKLRTYLINELLENIVETATENYNMDEGTTESPAMIVLDEAHYIVPENTSGLSGDQKRLLQHISSSVKTTRKYGVGWMFITQLITDFKKDVYKQLTNHYFLYGLQIGTDRNHVKETVGSDNIRLYEAIADPKTTGKFPVMIKGPVVGFSSMHAPIVLIGPISDSDFVRLNMYEDTQFPERFNQNKGKSIQNYQEYQAGQSGNFSIE